MENRLPFEELDIGSEESFKSYVGSYDASSLFGFPANIGGFNRKGNFAFTKRGVAIAYMLVPVLKSAVDVIAENLASVPMVMKDKAGKIVSRSDGFGNSDSKFLQAVERSYNHYGQPLLQLYGTALLLYGESFIEKTNSTTGMLYGLKWLNPLAMSIYRNYEQSNEDVVFWWYAIY